MPPKTHYATSIIYVHKHEYLAIKSKQFLFACELSKSAFIAATKCFAKFFMSSFFSFAILRRQMRHGYLQSNFSGVCFLNACLQISVYIFLAFRGSCPHFVFAVIAVFILPLKPNATCQYSTVLRAYSFVVIFNLHPRDMQIFAQQTHTHTHVYRCWYAPMYVA